MAHPDMPSEAADAAFAQYGLLPPPWYAFPEIHPYSIGWRMGSGEGYLWAYDVWWPKTKDSMDEEARIAYFLRFPPPPQFMRWMMEWLWDLEAGDPEEFDYGPYFARAEKLGFPSEEEFKKAFYKNDDDDDDDEGEKADENTQPQ
ncbi:hypothetical protein VHEMI05322 [[Torrubiella] hemipterigena]|uniref:Uncharacterized protein n=1 Tax=[Torrubiella] hemipterigena TaxID=1531966 RepID=A0A0A1SXM5_9HYPO|nr:hypothetical protein VHEMI05322 [[Torrubiella] hemipterigena]